MCLLSLGIKAFRISFPRSVLTGIFCRLGLLLVHDELVFDAVKSEVKELKPLIVECMQSAMLLPHNVPVIAECGEGNNWLEAH